ncbi:PhzF family phenazine biosynthesis protein [Trujillonella endophytica]|uniref:Trans-2,3-dihydro-3-hydroxyanthranilate isomerase n=1 Tax=Trujillonella endophytica TaxID=673521 RepID=A0A1H8SB45_9ACTN|nr:PhzF family phenazine biosynthesis protein [Trujillella endophytica]SEO75805.1 trans-2,3-dihydro-3-hydroxyanthranilate isomerase [Trujillella endophytica]
MDAPPALAFEIVDVFAPRPFAGNQLAVVLDADGLTTAQCQALAAEFGFSETSFLSAPDRGGDYAVRIFTPRTELPFAGHPSVGAAHTLVRTGRLPAGTLRQECGAGVLDVVVDRDGARLSGGRPTLELGPDPAGHPADVAGCGLSFAYLHVHPDAVDRAVPDPRALERLGGHGVSVFSWDHTTATARARVFAQGLGWGEDPATGSAALGAGVWLVATCLLPGEGDSDYVVHQGELLGRPSVLTCTATATAGVAVAVTVAGAVVPIASGRIRVP